HRQNASHKHNTQHVAPTHRHVSNKFSLYFVLAPIRTLKSSIASSSRCRFFQNSAHRSPFSFKRAETVFMFRVSGRSFARSSLGKIGVDTGALGNARTEYGAAS